MKRLILSVAAVALLGGPAIAQNNPNQDQHKEGQQGQHGRPANAAPARSSTPPARGPAQGNAPAYRPPQGNYAAPRGYTPQNRPATQGAPAYRPNTNGQYRSSPTNPGAAGQYQGAGKYQGAGQYQGARQYQGNRQYQGAGQYQGNRAGQYQGGRQYQGAGQYQGHQSTQYQAYRSQYQGNTWRGGTWRNRTGDWWRGQQGWQGYHGARSGYWYAPGWGYYSVDPRWYGYDWVVGAIVPYQFLSYYVTDPYAYGLPPAPYGAAWIFLGDRIVLVDLASGQILDIAYGY